MECSWAGCHGRMVRFRAVLSNSTSTSFGSYRVEGTLVAEVHPCSPLREETVSESRCSLACACLHDPFAAFHSAAVMFVSFGASHAGACIANCGLSRYAQLEALTTGEGLSGGSFVLTRCIDSIGEFA